MTLREMLDNNVRLGYVEPWHGCEADGSDSLAGVEVRMIASAAIRYYRHHLLQLKPEIALQLAEEELLSEFMANHCAYIVEEK